MKTSRVLRLVVGLSVMLAVGSPAFAEGAAEEAPTAEDPIEFRYSAVNPPDHPLILGVEEFARLVEEKSDGTMTVEVFHSGQLGGQSDNIEGLQTGAIDMTMTKPGYLVDYGAESLNVLGLPYIFRDYDHMWNALESPVGQELLGNIQEADTRLVGLGYYPDDFRHFFFAEDRVESLDDMEGLQIRVQQGQYFIDFTESFGANATPIAFGELYSALQNGVVDGAEQPLVSYHSNSFHEVSEYFVLSGHEAAPSITLVSERVWEGLTEEQQEILREAKIESQELYWEETMQQREEVVETIQEAGVEIIELDDLEDWRAAVEPMYEEYAADYTDYVDRLSEIE